MKIHKFKAKIQAGAGGGAYVLFPFDVEKAFGTTGKIPVKGAVNGVPFSGSLIKYGHPLHVLGMPKAIREQAQAALGDVVGIELWKDEEPRTIQPPAELQEALIRAGVMEKLDRLSNTHRREYCRWIREAKREETRRTRITKATEMLKKGIPTQVVRPKEETTR
ncbi:MAG TPA: YdeI/OmpD-associated family protein [Bryobacteraceae bacterium]|nr:YdeI/OmpD-associated family protein [Bryobacteraceae bacterium]